MEGQGTKWGKDINWRVFRTGIVLQDSRGISHQGCEHRQRTGESAGLLGVPMRRSQSDKEGLSISLSFCFLSWVPSFYIFIPYSLVVKSFQAILFPKGIIFIESIGFDKCSVAFWLFEISFFVLPLAYGLSMNFVFKFQSK